MERVTFIEFNGKKILHLDLSGIRGQDAIDVLQKAKGIIRSQAEKSLRILTDVADAHYDDAVSDAMKEFAQGNKPYVKASAVVGVTGLRKILFGAVVVLTRRKIETFDDIQSAKEWLTID